MQKTFVMLLLATTLIGGPMVGHAQDVSPKMQQCINAYPHLAMSGLLRDANLTALTPVIIVDESTWRMTEFKEKAQLGDLMKCLFAPDDPDEPPKIAWYEIEFRSNMTNKILGKLRLGKLEESE
jgi:hypothetical protein